MGIAEQFACDRILSETGGVGSTRSVSKPVSHWPLRQVRRPCLNVFTESRFDCPILPASHAPSGLQRR